MLEKRYALGLFLSVFLFGLASFASATSWGIVDASVRPASGTTFAVVNTDRTIALTLNITNTTVLDYSVAGNDYYDNITNITVNALLLNNQQILLGSNTTGPGNGGALVSLIGPEGNLVYPVEVILTYSTTVLNETVIGSTGSVSLNISFDVYNLTGNGEFNDSISDTDTSFIFDVFGPSVTIKFLDILNNEKTTFQATDKVKIVCTRSSALSNFNDTNISIQVPGGDTFDHLETSTTRASAATDFEVEFTNTRELGDYTAACFTIDDNGLLNDTTNATFTIVKKTPRGSSPFVNPDFKPPVATILVGSGSVSSLGALTEEGTSRLLAKTGAVSFVLDATTYTITFKDFTETAATFTVEGTNPFDITVNAKESKNVDVSGDGTDDITIVLHQVFNKRADTTFKLLTVQQAPPSQQEEQKEEVKQPTTTTKISSGWGLVVFIFLVVLFILGALHYFSARRRKGGSNGTANNLRFTARDMGLQRSSSEPGTFTRY